MHEMSLAESVLQIIEQAGSEQGFTRVRTVWLEIGKLACVEPAAMRFCFDEVMAGGIADRARLEIIETAGQGWCAQCECVVPVVALHEACPHCGGYQIRVTGGNALRVRELEVE